MKENISLNIKKNNLFFNKKINKNKKTTQNVVSNIKYNTNSTYYNNNIITKYYPSNSKE